jgi:hypothetical protein
MMFRVVHTTPKRVWSHLLRLKREGEALLNRPDLDPLAQGMWADRMFRYLKKISADPETFERVIWNKMVALALDDFPPAVRSGQEMANIQRKHVEKNLVTLTGAIEQFEAQYEM